MFVHGKRIGALGGNSVLPGQRAIYRYFQWFYSRLETSPNGARSEMSVSLQDNLGFVSLGGVVFCPQERFIKYHYVTTVNNMLKMLAIIKLMIFIIR